jgi:hypothetical protein
MQTHKKKKYPEAIDGLYPKVKKSIELGRVGT